MAKQLNVNLAFNADTSKAKQQMDDLSASLNRLMANAGKSAGGLGLTQELAAATNEVAKLQSMLDASKNAFGGLDLGKFNQSLKQNGIEITDYAKTLSSLGPAGDQAFAKLARSIVQAEIPLKRTSRLLSEFKTTLMNTTRWQISSSIVHGFMGALQGAYRYAQDLNESLNNIRIVTGYSKDEMAAFAEQANKAAKALSTTTTEYTNASLIYYQQGLSAEEVQKRTDITVKMANVARQSAEVVSDQMTAVWNNFYDGTKSLEYYADVMTALGAKTASSTDEIAGGLEKFAAIGDTIGLSYEYAASALATITSNTRQSEEVVGTALKTIFARIQGLNLGDTLDDGTTLNKYSEALEKVGISIFDQAGELKNMDTILDEMGSKWNDLNSAQQTALAQTVAGVRQYTQLVALMENWDSGDSDSFQANLETTATAEGALQEQADIYAESWEAAQDRVTAALEEIYNQLLDDDFFIGITDGFAGFLNIVSNTIDSLGGLSGVLTVASSIMFKMFGKDMATMIDNWAYNLKNKTQGAKQDILKMRQDMIQSVKTLYANSADDGPVTGASSTAFGEQAFLADALLQKQQELVKKGQQLSETDKQQVQYLLQINEALGDQAIQAAKNLEIAGQHGDEIENQLKKLVKNNNASSKKKSKKIDYGADIASQVEEAKKLQKEFSSLEAIYNKLQAAYGKKPDMDAGPLIQDLQAIRDAAENANLDVTQFDRALEALKGSNNTGEALGSIETEMYEIGAEADQASQKIRNAFKGSGVDLKQVDAILDQLYDSWVQQGIITADVAQKLKNVGVQAKDAGEKIKGMDGPPPSVGQKIVAVGNLLSNVAMSVSSIKGLFDTWNNEDMSFGDKLISTFTTLGMVIPMVTSSLIGNNLAMLGSASASIATALGFDGVAISAKVAAGGIGALWAALWPITLIAAGVAAAIALITVAVKAASDAYNADAIEAEKAAKAAKDLAESHEEAKQTLEDLQSAFSQYDEVVAALESCTEGTEEWNTALQKVNETVLNLMNEYPHLLKDADVFTRNEITGMLELNRKKQQEILDELEKNVSITQAASLFGAAHSSEAQVKSDKTNITRSIGQSYAIGQANQYHDAVVYDDYLNVGKILTDNALELADLTETEYREKVSKLLSNAANDQAKSYRGFDAQINNLVDKCVDYQFQIDNLADNTEAAANQMANIAQLIADSNLGDEYDSAEKTMAGYALEDRQNELKTALKTLAAGNSGEQKKNDELYKSLGFTGKYGISQAGNSDNDIYKFLAQQLEKAGTGYSATTGNTVQGTDSNRTFVFQDAKGEKVTKTADWVAETIATSIALQELGNSAKEAQTSLNTMENQVLSIANSSKAAESQASALRGFISSKNFDSSSMADFSALSAEVAEQGGSEAYVKAVFGQNGELTDEMANKYGYETAAEFINAFNTKLTDMESAWNTIELPADLLGMDKLSFTAAKALHDVFYDINIGPLGERAGKQFTEGLNKMIEGVKAKDQAAALNALVNVDWSSWDALDQADLVMQQFGVDIDTASNEWISFAHNMRLATNATPDYSQLKQTLMDVTAIISDLEFGSIIEDEDYEKLIKYNDAWKEFFILQADGSRKFIGDSEDMMAQTRARIIEDRKALQERQKIQSEWKTVVQGNDGKLSDWGAKSGTDTGTARNLMNAGGKTEAMLELLGYTDERIQEMLADAESADAAIKQAGQDAIEKMYRAMADFTEEDLVQAEVDLNEMMASTAVNLIELQALLASNQISAEAYDKQLHYLIESQAEATESLSELKDLMGSLQSAGESMDYETYADNLIRLAEEYDNCTKEVKEYKRALANGDSVDEAEDALEASLMLAEAAEEYNLEAKELEVQSRQLAKAYNLTAAAAAKLAIQNQRMNKGIVTLAENWEEWNKALTDSDTTTTDFANALIDCTAAVADLVGASADLELPDDFFNAERLALLEQAINGDINAINQLGFAVAEAQIKALEFNAAFASLSQMMDPMGDVAYDEQSFGNDMQLIVDRLEALRTRTDQISADMGQDWVDALNRMAKATGMSVDEMNQLLGTMGVQAKVKVDYVEQEMQIPTYTEVVEPGATVQVQQGVDENGNPRYVPYTGIKKYTVPGEPVTVTGYAAVAQISTEENPMEADIDESAKPNGGSSGGSATWTGNRGSIAPSTSEKVKETKEAKAPKLKEAFEVDDDQFKSFDEEVERYHEINNELEVLADNLDAISKEKDRAYGANRVKLIDQETAALKQQLSVQERYIDEIEDYLADDRAKIDKYGFMFNEDADIINYDEVMDQQIQAYNAAYQAYIAAKNAAVDAFNAAVQSGTSEEDAEKIYDAAIKAADATWEAAQERYETFEKELQQYEESVDLLRQQEQVLQDIKYQIQDLNYEKIQYKLEVKMEINDAEMRMLDYYLNKLSDDFYSMAEAAQLMVDKVPLMTQALGNYESFYNELESAYAAGDISQEAYVDGLKQSYDGILDNLEALQDLDKEMMHYYEDTLVAGQEELAHYTDSMEHLTSVLDHYHNLIVMINGEYDYDSIGTVLEGKASTIKNELEVASANYEMLLEQQALIQSHYDNAIDENARALHAEELKAINAQVDEAHELMLSKTEEWAEVQKAIMENIMAKAAREMEMAFTNNMGFDALSNSLDRLSSTADVYLTETNKIYETQTLINKAQKDIDKTTNNAAKIRLKNYQEEIELLQNKNKLTKVELDIAKAKYDVLLAEIALEEAQNAKSTVRLQRDNEGNYGYVYTADQSKVADAEQNLLDTQNALYNIRLEAANEYGQKIMELNQQLADDLMALEQARVDGQFATEAEYQAAKDLILQEYYALYEGYSQSYTDATKEDARIEKEAWISVYSDIIDSANNWQYKVNEYTDKCEDAYRDYRNTVSTESDVINRLLGDVEGAVKDVTKESDNLKNKVKNEVIPQIRDQYTKVANVTAAYAAQRTGILQLIQTYEQLAQSILKAMQAQANLNALEETPTGPTVPQTQTNNKPETKPTTEDASAQDKARAKAIALEAQEIVTKVHTGAIPMHSSGLGWQPSAREQGYSEDAIKVALQAFNDSKPGAGWDYYYDIALQLASRYNTGGYTGVWGPDGRMAILDEKELVLNQHDTENFLMATEILRNIVDIIDFNSLHNQISWLSSTGFASAGAGPLEQSVSIEAHFPNVSDRNEIEEAFNNLINTASQYANRKF